MVSAGGAVEGLGSQVERINDLATLAYVQRMRSRLYIYTRQAARAP